MAAPGRVTWGVALALLAPAGCLEGLETGSTVATAEPPPTIHTSEPAEGTAGPSVGTTGAPAPMTATWVPPPPPSSGGPATAAPAPVTAAPAPVTAAPAPVTAAPAPVTAAPAPATAAPAAVSPGRTWAAVVQCTAAAVFLDGREAAPASYGSIPADRLGLDPDLGVTVLYTLRDSIASKRATMPAGARMLVLVSADPDVPYRVAAPAALAAKAAKADVLWGLGGTPPAVASDAAPTKAWDRPSSPSRITDSRPLSLAMNVLASGAVDFSSAKPLPYGFAGRPGARIDALSGGRVDVDRIVAGLEAIKKVYPDEAALTISAEEAAPWRLLFPLLSAVRLTADGAPLFPAVSLGAPK